MKIGKQQGFTLIELMIVAVIIAILAAVAIPSYQQYVIRSNRVAAQSAMMDIANRQQQFFLANRSYATTPTLLNYTPPAEVSSKYTATVNRDANNLLTASCSLGTEGTIPSFVVVMTPIAGGLQAPDGILYLSDTGIKCPSGKW